MRDRSMRDEHWVFRRPWLAAALLFLPMGAVYAAHFLLPPAGEWPTGFLQYDQQSYLAMARQAWEGGAWPLFALPTSADPGAPAQYLYPHIALLGLAWGLLDADPGRVYVAFGAVAGLVFLRLAIALYGRVVARHDGAAALGLLLFAWGGGLLTLAGGLHALLAGRVDYASLFALDPEGGFWFLNLGRNLFYGVEAYYHALALGLLLALLAGRWRLGLLLLALLAASHPFTGLQFLLIALAWQLAERLLRRPDAPPLWLLLGNLLLLGLFLAYHFLLLPRDPEHAALMAAWSLAWTLETATQLLAYGPVALLAALWLRRHGLGARPARLLTVMAVVSLGLANHELLLDPRQPLHFTRGYIWMPLFLLGAPLLVDWLARRARPLALAVAALFLLDNAAWLGLQAWQNAGGFGAARTLTQAERGALAALNAPAYAGHLLVAEDPRLGYDALVYTPLQAWYSQQHSTPRSQERLADIERWLANAGEPAAWRGRPMVFLLADRGQDPAAYPWVTAESRVERRPGFLLVARPPLP
jgi:hypothetical protein